MRRIPHQRLTRGSRWLFVCRFVWSVAEWCCTAEQSFHTGPTASVLPGTEHDRLQRGQKDRMCLSLRDQYVSEEKPHYTCLQPLPPGLVGVWFLDCCWHTYMVRRGCTHLKKWAEAVITVVKEQQPKSLHVNTHNCMSAPPLFIISDDLSACSLRV